MDEETLRELEAIGLELPEQLGALFIGDASYLRELTEDTPPLTDDTPRLIQAKGSREERDALMWQWRDTRKARDRFLASPLINALWPPELKSRTARQFENQRLLNDLLFPEQTPVRQTQVLHQVLQGTPLKLPVLMMMNSDPDVQRKLAKLPEATRMKPEWAVHRAAGLLAERDFAGALQALEGVPQERMPLADLRDYLAFVVQRTAQQAPVQEPSQAPN